MAHAFTPDTTILIYFIAKTMVLGEDLLLTSSKLRKTMFTNTGKFIDKTKRDNFKSTCQLGYSRAEN